MLCEICHRDQFRKLPFYYAWNNKEFQLVKCRHCRLITIDPKPNAAELKELYSEDYFDHSAHGLNTLQQTYEASRDAIPPGEWQQKVRQTILKAKPDAKSLFEIGAAMGYFLNAAKSLGLTVSGLEISMAANRRAKEKFDLDLYDGDFETTDLSGEYGKWDVVYGGDVFEHFSHPSIVVEKIYRMLKPGGIAYLVVPSSFNLFSGILATGILSLAGKRKQMADNPYHLFEYTSATAKKMLQTQFGNVRVINAIKKPSELNLKNKSLEYRIKQCVHYINYPYTRLTGTHGDRLTIIAQK